MAVVPCGRGLAVWRAQAKSLINKDTAQIHAARWFVLNDPNNTVGLIENIDLVVWPRPDLERIEVSPGRGAERRASVLHAAPAAGPVLFSLEIGRRVRGPVPAHGHALCHAPGR